MSGQPVSRISASASWSASLKPARPSNSITTRSAMPTAASASRTTRSDIRSRPPSSSPPLSIRTKSRSSYEVRAKFRSRVVPGIELVMARAPAAMRLNSVDLPALTRPASTTVGNPCASAAEIAPGRESDFAARGIDLQSHFLELARIAGPVAIDLHQQLEENLPAEDLFELDARGGADFLEHAAAGADHDSLVRFAIDNDGRGDLDELFFFVLAECLDRNCGRKRNLALQFEEKFLAHNFFGEGALGLVGVFLFRHERGT